MKLEVTFSQEDIAQILIGAVITKFGEPGDGVEMEVERHSYSQDITVRTVEKEVPEPVAVDPFDGVVPAEVSKELDEKELDELDKAEEIF